MEELKKKRDFLQGRRTALLQKLNTIEDKIKEIEDLPRLRALVGTCWKYRNSYSCPERESDYWWMYIIVTSINDDSTTLRVAVIQQDSYGEIRIETNRYYHENMLQTPIKRKEFDGAWDSLIASITIPGEEREDGK